MALPALVYASCVVLAVFLPAVYVHAHTHRFSATHAAVSLFHAINVLICLWENGLYLCRDAIKKEYARLKKTHGKALPADGALFRACTLKQALSLEYWACLIWSTYSLLDPSYSDATTFGFWIDTGNGVSMPIPSLIFLYGMTFDMAHLSARSVGTIALVANWQMLYGTLLYFSSYVHNRRYLGCSFVSVLIVVFANGLWLAGPAASMYVGWAAVRDGSFQELRRT